jgi:DNA-binding NtrC family response regulator
VPLLVAHFVEKFNAETGKRVRGVTPGALALLQAHSWPGNVRELRNALERAMILADGEVIGESLLPSEISRPGAERAAISLPLGVPLDEVEREYLLASLERLGGNKARTAAALGISEKTLYNKLHCYAAEEEAREAREPANGT